MTASGVSAHQHLILSAPPWSPTLVVICIAISLARPGGVGEESLAVLTMPDNSSPADR